MKSCFLIGHRDAPEEVFPLLRAAVERHIVEYGVTSFLVGHYGGFDCMAAQAVREAKRTHPEVRLTLLLPYYPYPAQDYDGTWYPPGMETVPKRLAIVRANQKAIRQVSHLICYDAGWPGKTRDFVALARRLEKKGLLRVENLAKP